MRGLMGCLLCCVCFSIAWAGAPTVTKLDADTLVSQSQYAGTQHEPDDVVRIMYKALTLTQIAQTGVGEYTKFDYKKNPVITPQHYQASYATEVYTPMKSPGDGDFTVTDIGSLAFDWKNVGALKAYIVDAPKFFGLYEESRFVADFEVTDLEATGYLGYNGRVQLCAQKGGLPDLLWAIYTLTGKPMPVNAVIQQDVVEVIPEVSAPVVIEQVVAEGTPEIISNEDVPETMSEDVPDIKEQLRTLRDLFDEGLISERVYEERQQRILDQLP